MTKSYSVGFTQDAELPCTKWKSKNHTILKIFYGKESSNLIGREKVRSKTQKPDC